MKIKKPVSFILGSLLFLFGIFLILAKDIGGIVPLAIGASLIYLGIKGTRIATIIFGHTLVAIASGLITWGIYLLPYSRPIFAHIFLRPLFLGIHHIVRRYLRNLSRLLPVRPLSEITTNLLTFIL